LKVVDANVLLYAVNERSAHHRIARDWLEEALSGWETVGFSWFALLAFLRVSTLEGLPNPMPTHAAIRTVEARLSAEPAIVIDPKSRHLGLVSGLLSSAGAAGNLVNDAHLAALAIEHGAEVVSFDSDFARFPGLRWHRLGGA